MVDGVGTTHDVKIGSHHYLVKPGSFRKRPAPMFGARFTTGDPDYNSLSAWQHWVQKCWVGGLGAKEWRDEAMYDEGAGVDTRYHELMVLTRDLGPSANRAAQGWNVTPGGSGLPYHKRFFEYAGALYVLNFGATGTHSWLYRFDETSGDPATFNWDLVGTFTDKIARSACYFVGVEWIGVSGANMLYMTRPSGTEVFTTAVAKPAGMGSYTPYAMCVYKNRMYVGFGNNIYRLKPDGTWDGSTAFYTDEGANYFDGMEIHQGFLYISSQNGRILRTDGNNTFEIFQFDQVGGIASMKSFDGRLFIMYQDGIEGVNTDPFEAGGSTHMILYQLSGSALTELKRWGRVGRKLGAGSMHQIDGKLYFGAPDLLGEEGGGFGIAMYDPIEDAYHMVATMRDTDTYAEGTDNNNFFTPDVYLYHNKLFVSTTGHGVFYTDFTYRDMDRLQASYDTTPAGVGLASKNGGWYTSSDFDAGTPGLQKIWNAILVSIDLPDASCSALIEYSLDRGLTWQEAGTITTAAAANLEAELILGDGVTEVRSGRFKYRVTLRTTNSAYSPILRGVVVRYLPVPEPNWIWEMTLVLSEEQELHDKTIQAPNNAVKIAALRAAFRSQSLVHFTDPDSVQWAAGGLPGVLILSMTEFMPVIGPTSDGAREYEVGVQLMEMIEAYEE